MGLIIPDQMVVMSQGRYPNISRCHAGMYESVVEISLWKGYWRKSMSHLSLAGLWWGLERTQLCHRGLLPVQSLHTAAWWCGGHGDGRATAHNCTMGLARQLTLPPAGGLDWAFTTCQDRLLPAKAQPLLHALVFMPFANRWERQLLP